MKLSKKARELLIDVAGYFAMTLFGLLMIGVAYGWTLGIDSWRMWL